MAVLFPFCSQAGKVEIFVLIISNVTRLCLGRLCTFGTRNRILAHLASVTEFFRDAGTELFKAHKAGTVPVKLGQTVVTELHRSTDDLVSPRHSYVGFFFLDLDDIRKLNTGAIWSFAKGTGNL
jgi:hypothetical protein